MTLLPPYHSLHFRLAPELKNDPSGATAVTLLITDDQLICVCLEWSGVVELMVTAAFLMDCFADLLRFTYHYTHTSCCYTHTSCAYFMLVTRAC